MLQGGAGFRFAVQQRGMDAAADQQRLLEADHLQGTRPSRGDLKRVGIALYRQTRRCLYGRAVEA
eukprot:5680660-Alexandrium_andersonii.AAC.1